MFVKICGTTTEEDALLAVAMGADAVGFIFAPSPRQVRPTDVADIVKRLPPEILTVGVFRDEAPARVVQITQQCGLGGAQIHGSFTVDDARSVRRAIWHLIVAFSAGDPRVPRAADYEPYAVHLDGARPGGGELFDWALADQLPDGQRLVVAGGLDPTNVADAVRQLHPWGVDVATGVEASPGRKDPRKLRAFIANAKAAGADLEPGAVAAGGDPTDGADPTGGADVYDWQEDGA